MGSSINESVDTKSIDYRYRLDCKCVIISIPPYRLIALVFYRLVFSGYSPYSQCILLYLYFIHFCTFLIHF